MRKILLTIFILVSGILFSVSVNAQREIQFTYDNNGNMIKRTIYIPTTPTLPDGDLTNVEKREEFKDKIGELEIKIYPNPTNGILNVELIGYQNGMDDKIELFDLNGTLKQTIKPLGSMNTIYMNSLSGATYIMQIYINGETTQWEIIKL